MKRYVYPKGNTGLILSEMIRYCDGIEPILIDDFSKDVGGGGDIGLQHFKMEILQEDAIVDLAWNRRSSFNNKTMQILKARMDKEGIKYDEWAFEKYSEAVCLKLEYHLCCDKKWTIGIELSGLAEDKHIGFLDDEIMRQTDGSARIVYFCHSFQSYVTIKKKVENQNNIAVCLQNTHHDLMGRAINVMLKVSGPGGTSRPKSTAIFLDHGVTDYRSSSLDSNKYFDYLCVVGKNFEPIASNLVKIIRSGYLAFDVTLKEMVNNNHNREAVLIAPYDNEEFASFYPYIKHILKKYKVIMRDRGFTERNWLDELNLKRLDSLKENGNFILDSSAQITIDTYLNAFVMLASKTTSRFSFSLLTLCPSIVLVDDKSEFDQELGIVLKWDVDIRDLLSRIDSIYENKEFWRERILSYRNKNIYNYGCASRYLARYIIEHFK